MDAALGESNTTNENDASAANDDDLDFENFGKKPKKKKKPFNFDELENNLPSADGDDKRDDAANDAGNDGAVIDDDFDLDFSKTKKKKKKKKELDELVAEKTTEEQEQQTQSENGNAPIVLGGFFSFGNLSLGVRFGAVETHNIFSELNGISAN